MTSSSGEGGSRGQEKPADAELEAAASVARGFVRDARRWRKSIARDDRLQGFLSAMVQPRDLSELQK